MKLALLILLAANITAAPKPRTWHPPAHPKAQWSAADAGRADLMRPDPANEARRAKAKALRAELRKNLAAQAK
jgi:hypothetical protein